MIFITSFNERIFNLSGLRLLHTFIEHNIDGELLICYEDTDKTNYLSCIINKKWPKFIFYNLDNDKYLLDFLDENKDLIIEKHGGLKKRTI